MCGRPLFANPVTILYICMCYCEYYIWVHKFLPFRIIVSCFYRLMSACTPRNRNNTYQNTVFIAHILQTYKLCLYTSITPGKYKHTFEKKRNTVKQTVAALIVALSDSNDSAIYCNSESRLWQYIPMVIAIVAMSLPR